MNFLLSLLIFAVSVFLLGVSIRYGLKGAGRMDDFFSVKAGRNEPGFDWFYRIPGSIGMVFEFFFFVVIGRNNYFKGNWWAIKASGLLSLLIALATINGRHAVYNYFNLTLIKTEGVLALFNSGIFVWYLNIVVLLYLVVFVLIVVESIKMHGWYSPFRMFSYTLLSFLMADLSLIVIGLVVAIALLYLVIKIIWFFLTSSSRNRRHEEPEEDTSSSWRQLLREFKKDVLAWEQERKLEKKSKKTVRKEVKKEKPRVKIRRRKPKISRTKKYNDDIPRLRPD